MPHLVRTVTGVDKDGHVSTAATTPEWLEASHRIGIYGWRKRCLYLLVFLLLIMVVINIALTAWIIRVMDFSIDGMGKLRIVRGGIRLEGQAEFLDTLHAASIRSRKDQPLKIESSSNISLGARNREGVLTNRMVIGDSKVECYAERFIVKDKKGKVCFGIEPGQLVVATDKLKVDGEGGVKFDGSIQTPLVRASPGQMLRLESPTRQLRVTAPEGVGIESRAGEISVTCLKNLHLTSKEGAIWLDSERVELKNLRTVFPASDGQPYPGIYQVCLCENGRVFVSPANSHCQADDVVCR